MSGLRVMWFSSMPMMGDGVSGVAARTASIASTPCSVAWQVRQVTCHLPTTNEDPVIGARSTAALGVSERGDARVEAETLGQDVLDLRRGDGLEVLVDGALGDDDDGLALADLAVLQRSIQPAMP